MTGGRSWRRTPIRQQKRTPPNNQGGVGRQQQRDIDKLQLFYCNADSLYDKLPELEMRLNDRNIDVLVITEALPKNHKYGIQQVEFKIKNYNMISNFEMKTCHRGILIYVREYYI